MSESSSKLRVKKKRNLKENGNETVHLLLDLVIHSLRNKVKPQYDLIYIKNSLYTPWNTVLLSFCPLWIKFDILIKFTRKVKGTNYRIFEDFSDKAWDEWRKLLPYLNEKRKRNLKCFLKKDQISINNKLLIFSEVLKIIQITNQFRTVQDKNEDKGAKWTTERVSLCEDETYSYRATLKPKKVQQYV